MDQKFKVSQYCHINTNQDNDRFVGIKIDTTEIKVCFPIGYQLPEDEDEIKKDILHLIQILSEFSKNSEELIVKRKFTYKEKVEFPINAYLDVIQYFIENKGYYSQKNAVYKTKRCGNIDWTKTIKKQTPSFFYNRIPIYTNYTVRESKLNYNELITNINKYCVYESFSKIGWIFTNYMPQKPDIVFDKKRFIIEINNKLSNTNNDKEKKLFLAMIDILEYMDENTDNKRVYYGTNNFEKIWEKLIDRAFGIKNKEKYFPKTKWILHYGDNRNNHNLEPDTIMEHNNKIYILDAKYYRYGITAIPRDLPESSSINKQIVYGKYINKKFKIEDTNLYNAFLMPYNSKDNLFGVHNEFENIGQAIGLWKSNEFNYEKIQGILVDTRYLMYNYMSGSTRNITKLIEAIEKLVK